MIRAVAVCINRVSEVSEEYFGQRKHKAVRLPLLFMFTSWIYLEAIRLIEQETNLYAITAQNSNGWPSVRENLFHAFKSITVRLCDQIILHRSMASARSDPAVELAEKILDDLKSSKETTHSQLTSVHRVLLMTFSSFFPRITVTRESSFLIDLFCSALCCMMTNLFSPSQHG